MELTVIFRACGSTQRGVGWNSAGDGSPSFRFAPWFSILKAFWPSRSGSLAIFVLAAGLLWFADGWLKSRTYVSEKSVFARAKQDGGMSRGAFVVLAFLILLPRAVLAHEVPDDVRIKIFLKPGGNRMLILVRMPANAFIDILCSDAARKRLARFKAG